MNKDSSFCIYESHLGGYYLSEEELEDTYCETCGDSDTLVFEGFLWELEDVVRNDIAMLREARKRMGITKRRAKNDRR